MLTHWLCIDATQGGAITVCFRSGFNLVVLGQTAQLEHRGRVIALVSLGRA